MQRIAVIGNAGGGKSQLARRLSAELGLPYVEIDKLLWQEGWQFTPESAYAAEHARIIAGERWIIDGLGRRESIGPRLARASTIILVDLPLWVHYWLAAERQIAWAAGGLEHPPAGGAIPPRTEHLFSTMWEVDRDWMPEIRRLAEAAAAGGKQVFKIASLAELDGFAIAG